MIYRRLNQHIGSNNWAFVVDGGTFCAGGSVENGAVRVAPYLRKILGRYSGPRAMCKALAETCRVTYWSLPK